MRKSAKTITIFLLNGKPNGVKIVELSNRIIQAFLIPRSLLNDVKNRLELYGPALYVLCERDGSQVYIGESENFYNRIKNHDQDKDFWEIAIAFFAKDKGLEKGDVKYLECLAVEKARAANRFTVLNKTVPPRNNLHEFKVQSVEEFFEDASLLISSLGYPLFDPVSTHDDLIDNSYWYCAGKKTEAKGVYNEDGFVVLAGSRIDASQTPSFSSNFPKEAKEREEKLKKYGVFSSEGYYELKENIIFKSPSRAGGFCLGRSSNGWIDWKNDQSKTLDEVMRKKLN
jgi:hypothetical protein